MDSDFAPFLSLAGSISVTLWVVAIALVTIVLSTNAVGSDLGFLSTQVRAANQLARTTDMPDKLCAAFNAFFGQYRALWFTIEMLPIPMYFQIAMLLSLCSLIPNLPLIWLSAIPVSHITGWSLFITFLKRNEKRLRSSLEEAELPSETGKSLPDVHQLTRRLIFWQLPTIILSLAIFNVPIPAVILASVLICIVAGMAQVLRATANIIIARS